MWPNFILIVLRIQKKQKRKRKRKRKNSKVSLPLCSNVYDDITDFAICGFYKDTKIKICQIGQVQKKLKDFRPSGI